jgi:glycosyltransferase involved in cell wall biosynthesis
MPIFFSIIIPTYNRADFIKTTLESVLNQSYQNFEIMVVDDGSTDHTADIIQSISSDKIHYFQKKNGERGAARNFGILKAQGDYITFLDSDDVLYPNHFAEATRLITENQNPAIVHLGYEMKTPEGNILSQNNQRKGNLNERLLDGNHLSCAGVFVKNEVIKANLFNEDRAMAGSEDWELWLRLAAQFPIIYSNTITSAIINHENRSVLNIDEQKLVKRLYLVSEYLQKDATFIAKFGKKINIITAHSDLYIALHLILANQKQKALKYAFKAFKASPKVLFTRKFLAIVYKFLFK